MVITHGAGVKNVRVGNVTEEVKKGEGENMKNKVKGEEGGGPILKVGTGIDVDVAKVVKKVGEVGNGELGAGKVLGETKFLLKVNELNVQTTST